MKRRPGIERRRRDFRRSKVNRRGDSGAPSSLRKRGPILRSGRLCRPVSVIRPARELASPEIYVRALILRIAAPPCKPLTLPHVHSVAVADPLALRAISDRWQALVLAVRSALTLLLALDT